MILCLHIVGDIYVLNRYKVSTDESRNNQTSQNIRDIK